MPYITIEESEITQIIIDTINKTMEVERETKWLSAKSVAKILDLNKSTVRKSYSRLGLPEPKLLGNGPRPRARWLRDDVLALVK